MLRAVEDLFGGADLLGLSAFQDDDAVGDLGDHGEVVRDVNAGDAAFLHDRFEGAQHLDLRRHVERRRRLVEDDELRVADQRHGRRKPLQLAAGDLVRIAGANRFGLRQRQRPEKLDGTEARLVGGHKPMNSGDLDYLVHDRGGRVECGGG